MLQSIRDRTHGWIAGIIISLLILSFALWGIHSYIGGSSATTTVAKVNGVEITKGQLGIAYERLRRQLQAQNGSANLPSGAEAALKDRALQTLINIQILKQASLDQNYRVSDRQVDSLLESMPEFQVNGQFSIARFQQMLSTALFSAGDFLELIRTSLLIDQPRLGFIFSSFALPNEVNQAVALINQERDIKYTTVPVLHFLNQPITIANDKVDAYYTAHQNEFKTPEQVSLEYLQLSVQDIMSAMHPSDQDLKSFYNENSSAFAEPMQWKLDVILIPLSANASEKEVEAAQSKVSSIKSENFNSVVSQYPAGKTFEKLQDWNAITTIPQALQKTVMTLTKANQVSAPARIKEGIIVLRAKEVKEPKALPFEKVKDKVKQAYVRQKAEEKFADTRDKLASNTYEHPDSLQSAASALSLPIKTTGSFTKDSGGKDISSNQKVRDAAFSNDVLNLKNNSDLIQLDNDSVVVVRIKQHTPNALLPLKTVEKQIIDKLRAQEADAAAMRLATEIKDKLAKGATIDQINVEYHLSWNNTGFIGRHDNKVDTAILNEAFAMPRPENQKLSYSTVKVPSGYAIIALNAVKDGVLSSKPEDVNAFEEQTQSTQGLLEYELYKDSLVKNAKIEIESRSTSSSDNEQAAA